MRAWRSCALWAAFALLSSGYLVEVLCDREPWESTALWASALVLMAMVVMIEMQDP